MPVQDSVVIKVDVDVDGLSELTLLEQRFEQLDKRSRRFASRISDSSRTMDRYNKSIDRTNTQLDRHDNNMGRINHRHRRFARTLDRAIAPLKKFITTLSKLSFVALIGQIGLFTIGLLSAKLALITGRAAVQVYQIALKGLSVTAAGVATAVSVAAAAMRQFNEAMLIPSVGGGMTRRGAQNSALLSRSLGSRTTGLLGGEATTALLAGLAKAGVSPTASGGIARQLINLTGGDAAAVQSIAKAIGSKDSAELRSALSGTAGFRSGSLQEGLSTNQLLAALSSGSIVSENYRGVGAGLAGTFIGTAKTEFSGMKNMFADMGQPLLNPFRDAMMDMARIIRENFLGMSLLIQRFGADSFAPTLVTLVEKTMDFIRSNIFDHLENIEQMGESFVGFFRSIRDFFHGIGAFLVQFEPAANVVIDMFRAMGATGGGRGLFRSFSDLVVKNAEAFKSFGASIGNVFGAIFDLLKSGQSGFFSKLDLFSDAMNTVASEVIPAIGKLLDALVPILEQLPNALSGLASVLETLAPAIKTIGDLLGAVMGAGPAGGILGGLGLLTLMRPGRALSGVKRLPGIGRATPGFLASRQGSMMTGAGFLGFGAASNYYNGPSEIGTMSTIAGGAMMGASFGPMGIAIGAGLGAIANALSGRAGVNRRSNELDDLFGQAANIASEVSFAGSSFSNINANRNRIQRARAIFDSGMFMANQKRIVIDPITGETLDYSGGLRSDTVTSIARFSNFVTSNVLGGYDGGEGSRLVNTIDMKDPSTIGFLKFVEEELGVSFEGLTDVEITKRLRPGSELGNELQMMFRRIDEELETFDTNVGMLRETTSLTNQQIEETAAALGVDLTQGLLNAAGASAVFAAQILPLIDRNRAFFPTFSSSPLGQSEARATANAAFTTLANADKLTVDLVRDAFESFAAYEISMGMSPDVAGFSSNFELITKVLPNLSSDKQKDLLAMLASGSFEAATAMSQAYGIPLEKIMQFAGDDGIIGSTAGELSGIENFVAQRAQTRAALSLGSGLTGSQRFADLQAAGVFGGSDGMGTGGLNQALVESLGGVPNGRLSRLSTEELLSRAENQGVNTAQIVLQALTGAGLLDEDDKLNTERNEFLKSIQDDISSLRNNGIKVKFNFDTERQSNQADLPGGP